MTDKPSQLHTAAEIELELEVVDFVAGRMDAEARAVFEARMEANPGLAARVDEERLLSGDVVAAIPAETPPAAAFEKIRPSIAAPSSMPRWLPAAAAAGIVGVVLLFAIPQQPSDDYRLLSDEPERTVPAGNRYRVVFSEQSTDPERNAVAERLGFEIVSGPGAGGSFEVETADAVGRDRLAEWRADDLIELAEPIVYNGANGSEP